RWVALSIVIVLIPHIVTDIEINTLGGIFNAENRLSLFQGKRDCRHQRLFGLLSPEAMPENYHRQDIECSQVHNQHDTRLHRHSPSSMVKRGNARENFRGYTIIAEWQ